MRHVENSVLQAQSAMQLHPLLNAINILEEHTTLFTHFQVSFNGFVARMQRLQSSTVRRSSRRGLPRARSSAFSTDAEAWWMQEPINDAAVERAHEVVTSFNASFDSNSQQLKLSDSSPDVWIYTLASKPYRIWKVLWAELVLSGQHQMSVPPEVARSLCQSGDALLIDCRTPWLQEKRGYPSTELSASCPLYREVDWRQSPWKLAKTAFFGSLAMRATEVDDRFPQRVADVLSERDGNVLPILVDDTGGTSAY